MLARAVVLALVTLPFLLGCETPRDRACRSLGVQAANADDAQKTTYADPGIGAQRAESAARWLASNAVDDAELAAQRDELVAALHRLAAARTKVAKAMALLAANDVSDLVQRAARVTRWQTDVEAASRLVTQCPERNPFAYAIDMSCPHGDRYMLRFTEDGPPTFDEHADWYAAGLENDHQARPEVAANALRVSLREDAKWFAANMRGLNHADTLAAAPYAMAAVGERARADEDVARLAAALRSRCGS